MKIPRTGKSNIHCMPVYVGREGDKCQAKLKKRKEALKMGARAVMLYDDRWRHWGKGRRQSWRWQEIIMPRYFLWVSRMERSGVGTSEWCCVLNVSEIKLLDWSPLDMYWGRMVNVSVHSAVVRDGRQEKEQRGGLRMQLTGSVYAFTPGVSNSLSLRATSASCCPQRAT